MKKKSTRFKIKYRGYDTKEVEKYIASVNAQNESALMEQKERIDALKHENESMRTKISALESREEQIKMTLLKATKTAEELDEQIKRRYKAELKRLGLFRAKWTAAYVELKDRYHFSKDALNMESVAVQTELELGKFLSQEFSLTRGDEADEMEEYFKQEVERLTKLSQSKLQETAKAPKEAGAPVENIASDVFDLEEALNPTENLEQLCESLGLTKIA